jgi:Matrixin
MIRLALAVIALMQFTNTRDAIPYFIDDGTGVPGYRQSDKDLAKMALAAWTRESGGKLRFVEAKSKDDALLRVRWISSHEGLFGETQRAVVNGHVGAIVNVMPEVSQLGEPLSTRALGDALLRETIVYLTCVHELGHAVGLNHTRNFEDIMYSFAYGGDFVAYFMRYRTRLQRREDIAKHSGLSGGDIETLRGLYPSAK